MSADETSRESEAVSGAASNAGQPPPSPAPPRGPRAWVLLLVLFLMLAVLAAGVVWSVPIRSGVRSVFQAVFGHAHEESAAPGKTQYYTCGMHPWVVLPKPGECPICHMTLVPIDPAKFTGEIAINPIITQNIGVRVAPVTQGPVTRVIRTVGTVDYDERLVRDVNLKVEGWVQKLHVNSVGQPVKEGEPLLEIYSPLLYAAQEEYVLAFKQGQSGRTMDTDLLESARKRLEYLDISAEQIKELEKTGKPSKTMTLRSPFTGVVVMKNVVEGARVDATMQLLRIADLSRVWLMVTIYEYQIPYVEEGQAATISLPYVPGQTFTGKVGYVYPYLNSELRQVKVRVELDNPGLLLKPGMFANVELRRTLAVERTLVPREAVTDTGLRQVVFVSLGEGRFEPRNVQAGVEAENGMIEILDGVKQGEMVVVSGEFLLDSESRLRETLAKLVKGTPAAEQKTPSAVVGARELAALPDAASTALSGLLDASFSIGSALAADSIDGLADPAGRAAKSVDSLLAAAIPDDPHFWHRHTEAADLRGKALEVEQAKSIEAAREKFADMSVALIKLVRATGVPPAYARKVEALHCPMYRSGQGGTWWMQPAGEVRNPYYGKGSKMLGCFDKRETLPVTGAKAAQ